MLKLKASKVEEMVVDIVAEGSVQAKEIYDKAMKYYKKEIATKTCEDFMSKSVSQVYLLNQCLEDLKAH